MEKMKTEWGPMHFEFTAYRDTVSRCAVLFVGSFVQLLWLVVFQKFVVHWLEGSQSMESFT